MNDAVFNAILAMDSYNRGFEASMDGLSVEPSTQIGDAFIYRTSSEGPFYAIEYHRDGQKIISYRGTNNLDDSWTGWINGAGILIPGSQIDYAIDFYQTATGLDLTSGPAANVRLVGHSLGGGLAGFIASLTGTSATIYDYMPYAPAASVFALINSLTAPSPASIQGYHVSGEALESVRAAALGVAQGLYFDFGPGFLAAMTANATYVDDTQAMETLDAHPPFLFSPVNLHEPGLLPILLYAKANDFSDWFSIGPNVMDSLFNIELARDLGAGNPDSQTGIAEQLIRMIAYSAIDVGEMPFGNTGIASLFNDANELGEIVSGEAPSTKILEIKEALADIIVEYAGYLALNDITNNSDALEGILEVSSSEDLLTVDFSEEKWSIGASADPEIYGRETIVEHSLFSAFKTGEEVQEAMEFLWSTSSYDKVGKLVLSVHEEPANEVLENTTSLDGSISLVMLAGQDDYIVGSVSDDFIVAADGDDHLEGNDGSNLLVGGDGDDTLVSGSGLDVLVGGEGNQDVVTYADASAGEVFQLSKAEGIAPGLSISSSSYDEDRLYGVEELILTSFADHLSVAQSILNSSTSIKIDGGESGGGSGKDVVEFSSWSDRVRLINGDLKESALSEIAASISGFEQIVLSENNDIYKDTTEGVRIFAQGGDDIILGAGRGSLISLGEGEDFLIWSPGVAIDDLGADDLISLSNGTPLHGALRSKGSASQWATGLFGMAEYALNDDGDLLIKTAWNRNDEDALFVLNWRGTTHIDGSGAEAGAGGITLGEVDSQAYNILHVPAGADMVQGLRDFIRASKLTAFGSLGFDPLVLDLGDDGFGLRPMTSASPIFDLDSDLYSERVGWVGPTDGLLVRDLDGDGKVGDGRELFGGAQQSGFAVLATLDGNNDGVVDADDDGLADFNGDGVVDGADVFSHLKIWVDTDQNGVASIAELHALDDFGVVALGTTSTPDGTLIGGNTVAALGSFIRDDSSVGAIADVLLQLDDQNTAYSGPAIEIDLDVATRPNLRGFGTLTSLHEALSVHEEYLTEVDAALASLDTPDLAALRLKVLPILLDWAKGSQIRLSDGSIVSGEGVLPERSELVMLTTNGIVSDYAYEVIDQTVEVGGVDRPQRTWTFVSGAVVTATAGGDGLLPNLATFFDDYGAVSLDHTVSPTDPSDQTYTGVWPSGLMIVAERPNASAGTTVTTLFDGPHTDGGGNAYGWQRMVGEEVAFYERYIGQSLPLGIVPIDAEAAVDYIQGLTEVVEGTLDLLAVRLAVQAGPLSPIFEGVIYDAERDCFSAGTDRQLVPAYQNLFALAEAEPDAVAFLEGWKPFLDVVVGDYRQPSGVENTVGFLAQNILAAFENAAVSFDLLDTLEVLGVPRDMMVVGSGGMEGTSSGDIFYINGSLQTAEGGNGADTYVIGAEVGATIIDDVEAPGTQADEDVLRFTQLTADDVTATRDGLDLLLTVDTSGDTVRVLNQFTGVWPGPLGGNFYADNGVTHIVFADGVLWDKVDMAFAVTRVQPLGGLQAGTDAIDVLSSGASDDLLEGGGGSDIYLIDESGGADVIYDEEENAYREAFDVISFQGGITLDQLTFTRDADSEDVVIGFSTSSATLTIQGQFQAANTLVFGTWRFNQIELLAFEDGAQMSADDLMDTLLAQGKTTGNDAIYGFVRADTLDGGAGDDFLSGGDEGDVYRFGLGSGQDVVEDRKTNILYTADDTVAFGPGVAVEDVTFTHDGETDDLLISINGTSDVLRVSRQYEIVETGVFGPQEFNQIERFVWADETVKTWAELAPQIIADAKTEGADLIVGTHFDDLIDGGAGDDILKGGAGADTYVFDVGYGNDVVDDNLSNGLAQDGDTIAFGAGVDIGDLAIERAGADLLDAVLTVTSTGDTLTIKGQFAYTTLAMRYTEVEHLSFAGGSTLWSADDLRAAYITQHQSAGDDTIEGFFSDDVIEGLAGADILRGGDGSDTYIFNAGFGQDVIQESVGLVVYEDVDTIIFGAGFDSTDAVFSRAGEDLTISFVGSSDEVTIEGQFNQESTYDGWHDIEAFHFGDSVVWTDADIRQRLTEWAGTSGDDVITGFATDDILDGAEGNDTLRGGDGADTYRFGADFGQDVIEESVANILLSDADSIEFSAEYDVEDLTLARDGDDLTLGFAGTSDTVTVVGQFAHSAYYDGWTDIEAVRFADSTTLTDVDLRLMWLAQSSTSGADVITAFWGDDTIDGGSGNDTLQGNGGADTYLFRAGSGQDLILAWSGSAFDNFADTVEFEGLAKADVLFGLSGNNLTVSLIGTSDKLTIQNFWGSATHQVETFSFSDGDIDVSEAAVRAVADQGTTGADTVVGTASADVLDGHEGNDVLSGLGGNDTYLFGEGYGDDAVTDNGATSGSNDRVLFAADTAPQDFVVSRVGDNLVFEAVNGLDLLTVTGQFAGGANANFIESFEFDGGATFTALDLANRISAATGTSGADTISIAGDFGDKIFALAGDDTIDAGGGDDVVDGGLGEDTVLFGGLYADYSVTFGATVTVENLSTGEFDTLADVELLSFTDQVVTVPIPGQSLSGTSSDDTLSGGGGPDVIDGLAGADNLSGGADDDRLIGGLGDDDLYGEEGSDTYVFASGDGADEVFETNVAGVDKLELGSGLTASTLVAAQSGSNVTINFTGASGSILLHGQAAGTAEGVERLVFGDGGVWYRADLADLATNGPTNRFIGTASNETLTGNSSSNRLYGGLGNDTLQGGNGNDTYVYARGDGSDTITEASNGGTDTLVLHGVETGAVSFTRSGANVSLIVAPSTPGGADGGAINLGSLDSQFSQGVDQVVFDDATTWSQGDLRLSYLAGVSTSGADTIVAFNTADTLTGGLGNDTLQGAGGNDTYVYTRGDGSDAITEASNGGTDTLVLHDVDTSEVSFTRSGANVSLVIAPSTLGGTDGGSINLGSLDDLFSQGVDQVLFDDTTTWSQANLRTRYLAGVSTSGADTIVGFNTADTLTGGLGNDTMQGGTGNDTYVYTRGDGADVITEAASSGTDTLVLHSVATTAVSFTRSGTNVTLNIAETSGGAGDGGSINLGSLDDFLSQGVDQVLFDDTTTWSQADLRTSYLSGNSTSGADTITGFNTADVITGGGGADVLAGGSGADRFVYLLTSDAPTSGTAERITDFAAGTDKIDLSAIDAKTGVAGDQAFSWLGTSAFSNVAGQLRYASGTPSGSRTIYGDVDGDAVADFRLELVGTASLSASDFIL